MCQLISNKRTMVPKREKETFASFHITYWYRINSNNLPCTYSIPVQTIILKLISEGFIIVDQ